MAVLRWGIDAGDHIPQLRQDHAWAGLSVDGQPGIRLKRLGPYWVFAAVTLGHERRDAEGSAARRARQASSDRTPGHLQGTRSAAGALATRDHPSRHRGPGTAHGGGHRGRPTAAFGGGGQQGSARHSRARILPQGAPRRALLRRADRAGGLRVPRARVAAGARLLWAFDQSGSRGRGGSERGVTDSARPWAWGTTARGVRETPLRIAHPRPQKRWAF